MAGKWDKEEERMNYLEGEYKSDFEIKIDDQKAEYLMTVCLGGQMAIHQLMYQIGKNKQLLMERIRELYPNLDFDKEDGWAIDLTRKVIKKK